MTRECQTANSYSLSFVQLVEEFGVGDTIHDVFVKVFDLFVMTGIFQVPVHPTEEDLVKRKLQEVLNGFVLLEEFTETWMSGKIQILEHINPQKLPRHTQDLVLVSFEERVLIITNEFQT